MSGYQQSGWGPGRRARFAGVANVPVGLPPLVPAASQPGAYAPEQPFVVGLPGANYPPAGARPVDEIGDGDVAAGGSATLVTITVPDTLRLRVAGIGFSADDETSLRFLSWELRESVSASTIPGYVDMPASIGSVLQLSPVFVLLGSSVTMTLVATNNGAGPLPYHYVARVQGWFYLPKEGEANQ